MRHLATAPPRASSSPAATAAAIESLAATLAVAEALVAAGRAVDLTGLDDETRALCAALRGLDRRAARGLLPGLAQLALQVDRLRAGLGPPEP